MRHASHRARGGPAALLATLLLLGIGSLLGAAPAVAASPGYVRLAHFSPDAPKVDVWLTSFRGSAYSQVLRGVGYGAVSDYQRLDPGTYAVAMREPGAAADSPPLLRATLEVAAGTAQTVAGIGPVASLQLKVLEDDLTRPAKGSARLRVIQASAAAPVVDVQASGSAGRRATLAEAAEFPSTTSYVTVAAQSWQVRVGPRQGSAEPVTQRLAVRAGSIYSLVVLDADAGALRLQVLEDAAGASSVPVGAVDAGLGGTAVATPAGRAAWWLLGGSLLVLAAGAARLLAAPVLARRGT